MEVKLPTPVEWAEKRQPEIVSMLKSLKELKSFTVPNPTDNLNQLHTAIAGARNYQEWVKTCLVQAIAMELEVKRLLALAEIKYKDELGKAFTTHADIIEKAKSFEEKLLRLREKLPCIREKEEWEQTLETVTSFKQAVQLVYDDLSRGAMAIASQVNVIRSQILNGEIKIQVDGFTAKGLITENAMDAVDKASIKNQERGQTSFGSEL
ncbi:Uncharacterised protein [uncultured archaeon]|nr:Uncharacterised protein [uncultured archaeon]